MALNIKTFKTRTITAIVFAAVMLTGLFLNAYSFFTLFVVISIGSLYELLKILSVIYPGKTFYHLVFALFYIFLPVLTMVRLGIDFTGVSWQYNPLLPCAIIFSIWINDTMAYVVGSFIGKTPFSKISPNKTWEGTIGGAVLCVLVVTLLGWLIPAAHKIPWYHFTAIAVICAVFGTIGDLFESKLKRLAGVKDSGSIMPGHGGFLDRFDSLLIAAPFVGLYVYLFLHMT